MSTLFEGVWRGCEDQYAIKRSYNYDTPSGNGNRFMRPWDDSPPTPPMPTRPMKEAHTLLAKGTSTCVTCDKCDGAHPTSACPHFRKTRDEHKDAWAHYSGAEASGKSHLKARECVAPRSLSRSTASVVRMPGDGSCLFHSIAHGLGAYGHHEDGYTIRQQVASFLSQNADREIAGNSLRSWVDWDSRLTVKNYSSRLTSGGFWGGAIEMAACAQLYGVDVAVYEEEYFGSGFRRISDFLSDSRPRGYVAVLYLGRMHYDALVVSDDRACAGGSAGYQSSRYAAHSRRAYAHDEEEDLCSIM